jgi:DNA-binding CsgD family transcriptional regulator
LEKIAIRAGREDVPALFNIKPSEKELLSQLAAGLPQKQIAASLNLTESAVEKTLRKLRKQFSVSNTLELVRLLEQYRFFSGPGESCGRK